MTRRIFNCLPMVGSLLMVGLVSLICASSALASFGFAAAGENAPSVVVSNSADPGEPAVANPNDLDTQAGSHPFDMTTSFRMNLDSEGNTTGWTRERMPNDRTGPAGLPGV